MGIAGAQSHCDSRFKIHFYRISIKRHSSFNLEKSLSLHMHNAAHTMKLSDITTSAWLIDFCHKAIEP